MDTNNIPGKKNRWVGRKKRGISDFTKSEVIDFSHFDIIIKGNRLISLHYFLDFPNFKSMLNKSIDFLRKAGTFCFLPGWINQF